MPTFCGDRLLATTSTSDFLLTNPVPKNSSCASKMAGGVFARNAGKYVCISPDAVHRRGRPVPQRLAGFEAEVGVGGTINYTLQVTPAGNGRGNVTSSSGGINCGGICSAVIAKARRSR